MNKFFLNLSLGFAFLIGSALADSTSTEPNILSPASQSSTNSEKDDRSSLSYPNHTYKKHNFGGAGGIISGYGISYRTWNEEGNGNQYTLVPIFIWGSDKKYINLSAGYLRMHIFKDFTIPNPNERIYKGANIFFYYGGNFNYSFEKYNSYGYTDSSGTYVSGEETQKNYRLTAGGGIGSEIHFWIMNLSFMAGYAGTGYWEKWNHQADPDPTIQLTPSGEMSFYFNF